jgi:hypothetical protein
LSGDRIKLRQWSRAYAGGLEECILTGLAEQHRKTLTALAWLLREGHEAEMVEIVRRVIAVAEKKARKDA